MSSCRATNAKRRADVRRAEILRDEAEHIIEQADVNPKAWEAAR